MASSASLSARTRALQPSCTKCNHLRLTQTRPVGSGRNLVRAALFGWDPLLSKEEQQRRKDEQIEAQRAVLQRRKNNSWVKGVQDRRAEVKKYSTDKEYRNKVNADRKKNRPQKDDPGLSGIIIPLPPFGNPEMDDGERFDLKSPWIDEGWSDPTDSPIKAFGRLFGFGKKEKEEEKKDWQGIELARRAMQGKKK